MIIGGALAKAGRTVLIVDNDPQSSLTTGALGATQARRLHPSATLAAIYSGEPIEPRAIVAPLPFPSLSIMPNCELSNRFNTPEPHRLPYADQTMLSEALETIRDDFDFILIDSPPNLYAATWNALAASDGLIIPTQAEDYGIQGLNSVERSIRMVQDSANPRLQTLGIVISMFSARKAVHQTYAAMLLETYGETMLETRVPESIDFPEATMRSKPLAWWKPKSAAAKAIQDLAAEVTARIEQTTPAEATR